MTVSPTARQASVVPVVGDHPLEVAVGEHLLWQGAASGNRRMEAMIEGRPANATEAARFGPELAAAAATAASSLPCWPASRSLCSCLCDLPLLPSPSPAPPPHAPVPPPALYRRKERRWRRRRHLHHFALDIERVVNIVVVPDLAVAEATAAGEVVPHVSGRDQHDDHGRYVDLLEECSQRAGRRGLVLAVDVRAPGSLRAATATGSAPGDWHGRKQETRRTAVGRAADGAQRGAAGVEQRRRGPIESSTRWPVLGQARQAVKPPLVQPPPVSAAATACPTPAARPSRAAPCTAAPQAKASVFGRRAAEAQRKTVSLPRTRPTRSCFSTQWSCRILRQQRILEGARVAPTMLQAAAGGNSRSRPHAERMSTHRARSRPAFSSATDIVSTSAMASVDALGLACLSSLLAAPPHREPREAGCKRLPWCSYLFNTASRLK